LSAWNFEHDKLYRYNHQAQSLVQSEKLSDQEFKTLYNSFLVVISDQIAVLEHGRLVEKGTYTDLLSMENGTFRKLVQHQTFTV
jgi:ABC-type transport system involved in cytochrome bd biosynthesis fused ATPase/permease subunit